MRAWLACGERAAGGAEGHPPPQPAVARPPLAFLGAVRLWENQFAEEGRVASGGTRRHGMGTGVGGAEESRAIPYCVVCVCEESWYFVSDQCARLLTPPSEMAIGKADPELRF